MKRFKKFLIVTEIISFGLIKILTFAIVLLLLASAFAYLFIKEDPELLPDMAYPDDMYLELEKAGIKFD